MANIVSVTTVKDGGLNVSGWIMPKGCAPNANQRRKMRRLVRGMQVKDVTVSRVYVYEPANGTGGVASIEFFVNGSPVTPSPTPPE